MNQDSLKEVLSYDPETGLFTWICNSSNYKGEKVCNRYKSSITVEGKSKHLGTFDTPEEAHEVYLAAKLKLHGAENEEE